MSATGVLVTGASGLVGSRLVRALAADPRWRVVATDLRDDPAWPAGFAADLASADWPTLLRNHDIERVVHLAAVVATRAGHDAGRVREIEVGGTQRLFRGCTQAGVSQFLVASSGAAYGYAPGMPEPLSEDWPLRPHPDFPYSAHKQEIEAWLAAQPAPPRTLVLRLCTVLAPGRSSPVTALFERKRVLVLRGVRSPFCFVHVDDVAAAFQRALEANAAGTYNLAGAGVLELREIARRMGARTLELSPALLRLALRAGRALRLTGFTPGQVDFLAYRPVLDAGRLRRELGFATGFSSEQAFEAWRVSKGTDPRK
ncbi:MAG TPA: NAD-dependent epimerase/dehydratase family protein [Solimonas sp.]|nr:NAD-dependent epimerase/dehydratase family protein [Solimonas sp.]